MAFGDFVNSDDTLQNGVATHTADLGINPTSGNLLVLAFAGRQNNLAITTPPSGFTELYTLTSSGQFVFAWYYKVSDGTEQTASLVWANVAHGRSAYIEFEWDGTAPTLTKNEDRSNILNVVNTQATGAATPDTSTNICVALHVTDIESNNFDGQAVDGSWIEQIVFGNDAANSPSGTKISYLVNATGSQEATHTDTDIGDQMYGGIACFATAGAAAGIPIYRRRIEE